jgi:hypothetical protein
MAGQHASSPLRRGSLQDALLSCVRGEITRVSRRPFQNALRMHGDDLNKVAETAKKAREHA